MLASFADCKRNVQVALAAETHDRSRIHATNMNLVLEVILCSMKNKI